jgi:hypothetical protein
MAKRKIPVKRTLKRGGDGYIDEGAMASVVEDLLTETGGEALYRDLRERIPKVVRLTRRDLAKSLTRPGERMWEQILRNIASHIKSHPQFERLLDADEQPLGGLRLVKVKAKRRRKVA